MISLMGFVMMYSAAQGKIKPWAFRQIMHFLMFFPVMLAIAVTDLKVWYRVSYFAYVCSIILLILVEVSGHTAKGATRWINLGPMKLQPSELMKISLIFPLARYFHSMRSSNFVNFIPAFGIVLIPFALILKQPDLGTGLILLMLSGVMFFAAGMNVRLFIAAIIICVAAMPIGWNFLRDYQKDRVLTFLNPERDPLGKGYNIIQSKIAIGSGGISGKGILKGTQSQLNFLPEHQTDFIFTMFAEENGLIGGITLLTLYLILIYFGIQIAVNCRNQFGRLLAIGVTIFFFLHVFINMAMVMGLIPVVGVPLPLMSYGGTMMMTVLIGFGLIFNVHIHRNSVISKSDNSIL
jgi:rod shape determining protein RodA